MSYSPLAHGASFEPARLRRLFYGSTSPLGHKSRDGIGIFEALAAFSSECRVTSSADARLH